MGGSILIYDSADQVTSGMGRRAASSWGWKGIGVASVDQLSVEFARLRQAGARIDRMVFSTLGDPGGPTFGGDSLTALKIRNDFSGKGFEDLFRSGADVSIPGCPIASVTANREVGKAGAGSGNGLGFLMAFAETFLVKGGGQVHAWNTNARGWPGVGEKGDRWWDGGNHWYAIITPGGARRRIAMGKTLSSPVGYWTISGIAVDFGYWFRATGDVLRGGAAVGNTWGKWRMKGDSLRIRWNYGGVEHWDLPLYDGFQTGIAGQDYPIRARKTRELPSRVA